MHHYPHHIGDFNNKTRHLTRVERSLYRDLIELYYSTEKPLPADDFERLARRVMASSDEEKAALRYVLAEFFVLDGAVYRNARCDLEIAKYIEAIEKKAKAGKASAEAKKQKSADVQHVLDGCSTNQDPRTTLQDPSKNPPIPPEGARRGKGKTPSVSLQTFLDACKEKGEKPIPEGDPVFEYSESVGIPPEWLHLCWREFLERYRDGAKRYRDWRKVFQNAVRGNWYKLWYAEPDGGMKLTSQGVLAQRRHHESAARAKQQEREAANV